MSDVRRVFVLNAGSSSVKYGIVDLDGGATLASGLIERIGEPGSDVPDYAAALRTVLAEVADVPFDAVGHRVVHGGARFSVATLIDDEVVDVIDALSELAPLHNPPGVAGIRAARAALPEYAHVAVFDTAFHQTLGPVAYTYAIDAELAERHGVRRYGFHGTSFQYVSAKAAETLGRPLSELRMIVLHLGNGASVTAIDRGISVDTSMGLTPIEGLVMGTRSGDIDPGVLFHLARTADMSIDDLDRLLNRRSGVYGLAGMRDMRELAAAAESGDTAARLALEVYLHRIRHYIGAYAAVLGGVDAIVFTAGVGENSSMIRARSVETLGFLGVELDAAANTSADRSARIVSAAGSAVAVLVVPTNEELEIARQTASALELGAEAISGLRRDASADPRPGGRAQ